VENIEIRLQEIAERSARNEGRIEKLETDQKALNELTLSVQELATNQSNMKEDLTEIKSDVKVLTSVPAKRWDGAVEKTIAVLIGAFIAWLLAGT
jgi:predicted  nucleic acid-binding Zn-ribbon protein